MVIISHPLTAALDDAIADFERPENKELMETAIASCGSDPQQKMIVLLPLVERIQSATMQKYGFSGPGAVMAATMQIQMHAMSDPDMQAKVAMLMSKVRVV